MSFNIQKPSPLLVKAWCVPPAIFMAQPYCKAYKAQSMVPCIMVISRSINFADKGKPILRISLSVSFNWLKFFQ